MSIRVLYLIYRGGSRMTYAPPSFWDSYYQSLRQAERDLNPTGSWAVSWVPLLDHYSCTRLLDLGCGTGADCLVLARHGLDVTGADYSQEAVTRAQEKTREEDLPAVFLQADMTQALPFPASHFDAVMSNVAFHSFPDLLLRSILKEISRVLRPGGLFLFHVNSLEDMQYRPKERVQEIEPHSIESLMGKRCTSLAKAIVVTCCKLGSFLT